MEICKCIVYKENKFSYIMKKIFLVLNRNFKLVLRFKVLKN